MKPKPIDAAKIPPEVQRRILHFVNAARRPKDLLHPELPRFREDAGRKLIEGREAAGVFGFTTRPRPNSRVTTGAIWIIEAAVGRKRGSSGTGWNVRPASCW
jgi:hypothetical protein